MARTGTTPILVFDVNETLLGITTLEPLFERLFGDSAVLRVWFAQLVLHSQNEPADDAVPECDALRTVGASAVVRRAPNAGTVRSGFSVDRDRRHAAGVSPRPSAS